MFVFNNWQIFCIAFFAQIFNEKKISEWYKKKEEAPSISTTVRKWVIPVNLDPKKKNHKIGIAALFLKLELSWLLQCREPPSDIYRSHPGGLTTPDPNGTGSVLIYLVDVFNETIDGLINCSKSVRIRTKFEYIYCTL